MFTVYILYSPKFNKIYIGYTSDIADRFLSHNELATKGHTVKYRPWVIAHTEEFETKAEAMKRETQLKTANGRDFIWNIIHEKFGSANG
ncbi:MAG: GIY-YIG nuclease family protein [Bacteroidetes bacterium]|jgi:putative endonuclease|nr:GIY-YIG nuclease family protein [Bacteroidota bacterium]